MEEAYELAEDLTGIKAPKIRLSPGVLKFMSAIMKVVGAVIPLPPTYSAEALRVVAGVTYLGDNSKAKKELGYRVRPLQEGLKETLDFMLEKRKKQ